MDIRTGHWRFGKRVVIAALSVAAILGLVLGTVHVSAAVHPTRGGQARDTCMRALIGGVQFSGTLDELVADGTITADQQGEILARAEERRTDRPLMCTGMALMRDGAIGEAVAHVIGLDRREIRQAWLDGQSLSEIATANGVDRRTLIDTITDAIGVKLDTMVENGRIDEARKAEILADAQLRIEQAVDFHRGDLRDQPASDQQDSESSQ